MVAPFNVEATWRAFYDALTSGGTVEAATGGALATGGSAAFPAGTLANGAETAVSNTAVSVLAANTSRKKLIVQNTGANAVRIGIAAVTATTGMRLAAGASIIFDMPHCPTNAIFSIRESADSTVLAQEVT